MEAKVRMEKTNTEKTGVKNTGNGTQKLYAVRWCMLPGKSSETSCLTSGFSYDADSGSKWHQQKMAASISLGSVSSTLCKIQCQCNTWDHSASYSTTGILINIKHLFNVFFVQYYKGRLPIWAYHQKHTSSSCVHWINSLLKHLKNTNIDRDVTNFRG